MINQNSTHSNQSGDLEQIQLVLTGDRSAFEPLITKYKRQIYGVILSQVTNPEVATELAQETFVRAFKYLHTFKGNSTFSTWLTRIALNNVKTYFSSKAYRQAKQSESFDTNVHDQEIPETEDYLSEMRTAFSKLNDKYKEILTLKFINGLSYQDISKELLIPMGTVASRLNTAIANLKSLLKEVY